MKIVAISISDTKGVRKGNVEFAELRAGHGIKGDAHAGKWHRQISLLASESIARMVELGLEVGPGDFAENITTRNIELYGLPVGTRLRLGINTLVEITQIGKECHTRCAIYKKVGQCIMPEEGVFARVLQGGVVRPGDALRVRSDDDGQDQGSH